MINIIISSDPRYQINRDMIRSTLLTVLQRNRVSGKIEIGVNIVGARKIHELNRKYRGVDSPTDILSFALEDMNPANLMHIPRAGFVAAPDNWIRLGDIVLSYPQVLEDASSDGISVDEEIGSLLEHGMQHLLGVHHSED